MDHHGHAPTILISGASIAGPALAYWLNAHGWQTTVVERFAELRDDGQNIDVRGAGREVARRMGIEDAIRAAGTGETGTEFVDAEGRAVARFAAGRSDSGGATAELEILRGQLSRIIVERTRDATEYVFGDQITGLDDGDDGVDRHLRPRPRAHLRRGGRRRGAALPHPGAGLPRRRSRPRARALHRLPDHPPHRRRHRPLALAQRRARPQRHPAPGQRRHHPGHADVPLRRPRPRRARPRRRGHDPAPHVRRRRLGRAAGARRSRRRAAVLRRRRPGPPAVLEQAGGWRWSATRPTARPRSAA